MKRKARNIKVFFAIICLLLWINSCGYFPGVHVRKIKPFGPIGEKTEPKREVPPKSASQQKDLFIDEKSIKKLRVTVRVANIRNGPGTKFKIIANVREGMFLEQLDESGSWFKVRLPDGKIGWIYTKLVK